MRDPGTLKRLLRIFCVVIGLGAAAWMLSLWVLTNREYRAWTDQNGEELGRHQRIVKRFERRLDNKTYPKLPDEVYHNDALAAEMSTPIVEKLEGERVLLFAAKKKAQWHGQLALGGLVVLLVAARFFS